MSLSHFQLPSLTIFLPFMNDAGTVAEAIDLAFAVGGLVTSDLEVIAIHGGASRDETWDEIVKAKRKFRRLKVIDKSDNMEGYAVIKHGLVAATKRWVFYTDGDLQYDLRELLLLVYVQRRTKCDVVNGYKVQRGDAIVRTQLARLWSWYISRSRHWPIQDVDCDFRLIRRRFLRGAAWSASGAAILEELVGHLCRAGAQFQEIPVSHRRRRYGVSNYSVRQLVREKVRVVGI